MVSSRETTDCDPNINPRNHNMYQHLNQYSSVIYNCNWHAVAHVISRLRLPLIHPEMSAITMNSSAYWLLLHLERMSRSVTWHGEPQENPVEMIELDEQSEVTVTR
eukprot:scaffold6417_cov87-Cyclotella_meneghiniana.AAC.2